MGRGNYYVVDMVARESSKGPMDGFGAMGRWRVPHVEDVEPQDEGRKCSALLLANLASVAMSGVRRVLVNDVAQ